MLGSPLAAAFATAALAILPPASRVLSGSCARRVLGAGAARLNPAEARVCRDTKPRREHAASVIPGHPKEGTAAGSGPAAAKAGAGLRDGVVGLRTSRGGHRDGGFPACSEPG